MRRPRAGPVGRLERASRRLTCWPIYANRGDHCNECVKRGGQGNRDGVSGDASQLQQTNKRTAEQGPTNADHRGDLQLTTRMYDMYALDRQRPKTVICSAVYPLTAARVAAPIRKLCGVIRPGRWACVTADFRTLAKYPRETGFSSA